MRGPDSVQKELAVVKSSSSNSGDAQGAPPAHQVVGANKVQPSPASTR